MSWLRFAIRGGVVIVVVPPRVVRYLRAGSFERRALRACWRAKRRWRKLSISLDLSHTTPPAALDDNSTNWFFWRPEHRHPRIKIRAQPYGLLARCGTLPKIGLKEYTAAAAHIADAWGCETVEVRRLGPKWVELKGLMRDPLAESFPADYTLDPNWRLYLGKDPWGIDLHVPLRELSGIKVGGLAGYGKTMLLSGWTAELAQSPAIQFALFDGKTRDPRDGDWGYFEDRAMSLVGDDPRQANQVLEKIMEYIKTRPGLLKAERGTHKFWKGGPTQANPLVLVIVDECHNYTDSGGLRGAEKELIESNQRLCKGIAKEGRGLGVISIFTTQKQTGDAIPTALRDLLEVGVCFATTTIDGAEAALGSGIRKDEPNSPIAMVDKERFVGIAVAGGVPGRRGYTRFRTETHDEERLMQLVQESAHLRHDVVTSSGGLRLVTDLDKKAG